MNMPRFAQNGPVSVQRCDIFVGRTMNWLYDHLRVVPEYTPLVLTDEVANRGEFPELPVWSREHGAFARRVWRRLRPNLPYPAEVWRLRKLNPRVLHSHFGYVAVDDVALQQSLGTPWLVGLYGADVYMFRQIPEWLDRYGPVFERATRVLALGPAMAEAIAGLGCPAGKIHVHPLGVDVEALPEAARHKAVDESLRILFAGTFREKKGIRYLIEAAAQLRAAGVRFELELVGDKGGRPGDEETKAEVFQLIGACGLHDVVHHHSWLPFSELLQLAMESHVFVAPSVTAADGDAEGTPFVIQQMMATGMPVVSTRHSDIPFIFGDYEHMLVAERDAGAIAQRLLRYVDDPDRVTEDGQLLKHQLRQRLDARDRARRLAELYARLESA